jgi:glycosyltransferase involved in cell wall biosynthesis
MTRVGILAMAQQRHGGTLLYTRAMIEALQQLPGERFHFTIYTTTDNPEYEHFGLPIVRLRPAAALWAARLVGSDPFEAVDKVISPIYSTMLLATRRPFAFTLHDLQEKYFPENFSLAVRAWREITNRLLTRRAQQIICESNFVRDDIVQHFKVESSKIAVIPAPPIAELRSADVGAEDIERVRAKFNLSAMYVFYPAQFWRHKNHLRLVEAFAMIAAEFPACELVLTGKARDEYARVFERVGELGLGQRVRHLGYVEPGDLGPLYGGATVVAVPTLFESISIPVYEAFSMGIPVCVSAVVALPEQVGDAALLFDPLAVSEIAATMARLLRDPVLRAQLVERGYQRMRAVIHETYSHQLASLIDAMGEPLRDLHR